MYNRYIHDSFADFFCPVEEEAPHGGPEIPTIAYADIEPEPPEPAHGGIFGGIKLPELDADTIVLLIIVWFLIAEEGESMSDTLLIVGVLLLMGF